ncbi:glycosyltransferase, family 11 [Enterococcus faecalis 13-SD-W-01]|nr:glycosyltransferase, family 11 [Enterococcus faecalis 13-SD-W-01]
MKNKYRDNKCKGVESQMKNQDNIYLLSSGRLGNQLFQYAFGRYLALKSNRELNISFEALKQYGTIEEGWGDGLRFFNTRYNVFHERYPVLRYGKLSQKIKYIIYFLLKRLKIISSNKNFEELSIFERGFANYLHKSNLYIYPLGKYLVNSISEENKPVFVQGEFEYADYANEIREVLLTEFTSKMIPAKTAEDFAQLASSTPSVCLSIRRGDFLSTQFKDSYFIADEEYFRSAIQTILLKVENPIFFVFSDDIKWSREWWKKEFDTQYSVHFEKGSDSLSDKLYMMSRCKHFIISNSTFSWWAQWLSVHEEKIIISPDKWSKISERQQILIDNAWIKINTGNNN